MPPRQILIRLGWLLGALLMLSLLALAGLRRVEQNAVRDILEEEGQEHGRLLDGVVELRGNPLRLLVEDYARRSIFTRPNEDDHLARAQPILEAGLRLHDLDAAWVFDAKGTLRLQAAVESARKLPPPITAVEFLILPPQQIHFYASINWFSLYCSGPAGACDKSAGASDLGFRGYFDCPRPDLHPYPLLHRLNEIWLRCARMA